MARAFEGKAYLVTGASSGIGRAIARALLDAGAQVGVAARREARLRELAPADPARLHVAAGDVALEADVAAMVAGTVGAFGRLDGVVHAAGVGQRGLVAETELEVFRQLMEVDYLSTVAVFRAALPHVAATRGTLAAVSSVQGELALPFSAGYAAAKHAVQGFVDAFRVEVRDRGVQVLLIQPGWVHTEIDVHALGPDGRPYARHDPLNRRGLAPEQVADAALAAIVKRRRAVVPAGPAERLGLWLDRHFPGVLDPVLAQLLRRRLKFAAQAAT